MPQLRIAQDASADELLGRDPLALLIGMLLDQQFPMERAFAAPRLLADRLGVDGLDAAALLGRLTALPGFGAQKSRIFLALLGKQYGVTPPGWREAAGPYGEEGSRRSVADITGAETLAEVRQFKQAQKQAARERAGQASG